MDVKCSLSLRRLARLGIVLWQAPSYALIAIVALPPETLVSIEDFHTHEILWSEDLASQQIQDVLDRSTSAPDTSSTDPYVVPATTDAPNTTADQTQTPAPRNDHTSTSLDVSTPT